MGDEVACAVAFEGRSSAGKALLETRELIFRGDFRLSIPFEDVESVAASDGRLRVRFRSGEAIFELGPRADKWAHRILHPKTLVDKLGIRRDARVDVIGIEGHPEFFEELASAGADVSNGRLRKGLDAIIFGARARANLKRLRTLQKHIKPAGAIWIVRPKGSKDLNENDVLAAAKEHGLVDVKVVSFSDTHSALKVVIPVARRPR